jgi:co-chaperonin GroES (HSP10)
MNISLTITIIIVIIAAFAELFTYFHQHKHANGLGRTPVKWGLGGALKFWALGDRLLIQEDEFRSGYECAQCGGRGTNPCSNCNGTQITATGKKCGICADTDGNLTCPTCQGKGGIIIVPDTSKNRPTSGQVVSVGAKVHTLKPGDSVLYSNFAGHVVDLKMATGHTVTLRILHETEILAGMEGQLTLSNLKGKSEIATYQG